MSDLLSLYAIWPSWLPINAVGLSIAILLVILLLIKELASDESRERYLKKRYVVALMVPLFIIYVILVAIDVYNS